MNKLKNAFVVAAQKNTIEELTAGARQNAQNVYLAYSGERANGVNADKAYFFNTDECSFVNCVPAILKLVEEIKPELVLVEPTKDGRLVAAHIAFMANTSVLTDISSIEVGDVVRTKRMAYGGSAEKTETAGEIAVVCANAGTFKVSESAVAAAKIADAAPEAIEGVQFAGKVRKVVQNVNLNAASKVIGVGRGFSAEEKIGLARDLAEVLSAEIGCTRPIAEEEKWLPTARYIGVSGAMIKPALYIAAGISGQIQHMVGVKDAGLIIAINKDEHAPIFSDCDMGIVGDINTVLPLLTEKLKV